MVGLGIDAAVRRAKRVVCGASRHAGKGEAVAEGHAFDGGDGKQGVGEQALDGIEPRLAESRGNAGDGGLQHAADAVAVFRRFFNGVFHGVSGVFVEDGEGFFGKSRYIGVEVAEGAVGDAGEFLQVGADADAEAKQGALRDRARRDERGGEAAAEMPAAAVILEAVVLDEGGVVGVRGTRKGAGIVAALRIGIFDEDAQRRAGGMPFENAGDETERVLLDAGGGIPAAGAAKGEFFFDEGGIDGDAGGKAVDNGADGFAVAFAEQRDGDGRSEGVFHGADLPLGFSRQAGNIRLHVGKRQFFKAERADLVDEDGGDGIAVGFFIVGEKRENALGIDGNGRGQG